MYSPSVSLSLPHCSLRQQLVKINHTAAGTTYKVGQNAPRGTVWELVERERERKGGRVDHVVIYVPN